MEVLKAAGVGVLRVGGLPVDGGRSVRFSSRVVFGGSLRRQERGVAWGRGRGRGRREGRSGVCTCVATAAAAADEFVAAGTLYGVLGVELGGSGSEIKSAYKDMARRYHPDVCALGDRDACTQKFLEVRHAYEVLSDQEKRAEYDYSLMHPSFAQALGNRSTSSWRGRSRRTQGSDGVSDAWRFQWEAQLSRLRRHSEMKGSTPVSNPTTSWGARMRREKSEA